ncbi:MAG: thiamine-phosphate kinase [Chthoniobacterales bacterium]
MTGISEDELVRRLTRRLPAGRRVVAGVGDDCAAVRVPGRKEIQLLKTDCIVEGVHFLREHPGAKVGWKALCRAISDIAACGGRPDAALITIAAPADLAPSYLDAIYAGLRKAARTYGVSIVGGETARSPGALFLSIALSGWVKRGRLVLRSGGRAKDALFVTGRLGGSFASGRHLAFSPRVHEARWLVANFDIHAMMDLSDGLGTDLPRFANSSRKGYEVNLAAIPRHSGCTVGHAMSDGEDYELLFAIASNDAEALTAAWRQKFPRVPLSRIGTLLSDRKLRTPLVAGYTHFSDCQAVEKSD